MAARLTSQVVWGPNPTNRVTAQNDRKLARPRPHNKVNEDLKHYLLVIRDFSFCIVLQYMNQKCFANVTSI